MKKDLIQRLLDFQRAQSGDSSASQSSQSSENAENAENTENTAMEDENGEENAANRREESAQAVDSVKSAEFAEGLEEEEGSGSDGESENGEVETLSGFGGLTRVKDVDEYGRETDRVVSERCEVSVVTTFTNEALQTKAKLLSLDGLLEYRRKDTREKIFEVSLLGEVFKDMLMVRFGQAIGELLKQTQSAMKEAEAAVLEARAARETSQTGGAKPENETFDETPEEEKRDGEEPSKEPSKETPKETAKDSAKEVQAAKKSVSMAMSREMFIACRYFDGKNRGELSQEQLLHILLNSGAVCCKSEGEKLVSYVLDRDSLRYRKLYKN